MHKQRRLAAAFMATAALGTSRDAQAGLLSAGAHAAAGAWDWLTRPAADAVVHQGEHAPPRTSIPVDRDRFTSPLDRTLGEFRKPGASADPAGRLRSGAAPVRAYQLGPQAEPRGRSELLRCVRRLVNKAPRMVFASPKAKAFGKDFLRGAKVSSKALEKLRVRRPALVDPWLRTGLDRRVFVIGASQDNPDVVQLRDALKKNGFETFFYKFCEPHGAGLCTSDEVGAFFATAGHVVVMRSPAASASSFIPVELATSKSLLSGGLVVVFTPEDVAKVAAAAATAGVPLGDSSVGFPAEVWSYDDSDIRR